MGKVGLDTGFFLELLKGNRVAVNLWERIVSGDLQAVTSVLVFFELRRLTLRGMIERDVWEKLEEAIFLNCEVVSLSRELAVEAANVSYGTGLPAVDALIYTACKGCCEFYTTDSHFEALKERKPRVILLKPI